MISICLIGSLRVAVDDQPVDLGPLKQRQLFALLTIGRRQFHSLAAISTALWPESTPTQTEGSIRAYVSKVRKALGPAGSMLESRTGAYRLMIPDEAVDVCRFEAAIRHARSLGDNEQVRELASALELVSGNPLDDLGLDAGPDSPLGLEAARIQTIVLNARESLLGLRIDTGQDVPGAVEQLETLITQFPFHESLFALLMRANYQLGRQAEALRVFERIRSSLRDELGVDPSPELRRLEMAVLQHDASLAPRTVQAPAEPDGPAEIRRPLEGRGVELARLLALLGDTQVNEGRIAIVEGPAGIGKSHLVHEFAARSRERNIPTIVVYNSMIAGSAPLAMWSNVLDRLGINLSIEGAFNALSRPADHHASLQDRDFERIQVHEQVLDALIDHAKVRPFVMVLEDVHLIDLSSFRLLLSLARAIQNSPIMVVATIRMPCDNDVAEFGQAVVDSHGIRLALQPLAPEAALMVLNQVAEHLDPNDASIVIERAGGNPLYLIQAARLAAASDKPFTRDMAMPLEVSELIRNSIQLFEQTTADVLSIAACCNDDVNVADVAHAANCTVQQAVDALQPAVDAGYLSAISGAEGVFRFAHVVVREVLRAQLAPADHATYHAKLGEALALRVGHNAAQHAPELAYRFLRGVDAGTAEQALDWSLRATEDYVNHDDQKHVIDLLTSAVSRLSSLRNSQPEKSVDLMIRLGVAARNTGESDLAYQTLLDAFELSRSHGLYEGLARVALEFAEGAGTGRSRIWWAPGELADDLLEEARLAVPKDTPTWALLTAQLAADRPIHLGGDPDSMINEARNFAVRTGDRLLQFKLAMLDIYSGLFRAPIATTIAKAEELARTAETMEPSAAEMAVYRSMAALGVEFGDDDQFDRWQGQAERRSRRHRIPPAVAGLGTPTIFRAFLQGRFNDATEMIADGWIPATPGDNMQKAAYFICSAGLAVIQCKDDHHWRLLESAARAQDHPGLGLLAAVGALASGNNDAARLLVSRWSRRRLKRVWADYAGMLDGSALIELGCGLRRVDLLELGIERLKHTTGRMVYAPPISFGSVDEFLAKGYLALGNDDLAGQHARTSVRVATAAKSPQITNRAELVLLRLEHPAPNPEAIARVQQIRDAAFAQGYVIAANEAIRMLDGEWDVRLA